MTKRRHDPDILYIIAHKFDDGWRGPVKIGIASDPSMRAKTLQSGNPSRIGIYATVDIGDSEVGVSLEAQIHVAFSELRLAGEWFAVEPDEAFKTTKLWFYMAMTAIGHVSSDQAANLVSQRCVLYAPSRI